MRPVSRISCEILPRSFMMTKRMIENQVVAILKEAEANMPLKNFS
jgi:hypothetical protein